MSIGYLTIHAQTGDDALPVQNAHVQIKVKDAVLFDTRTDGDGNTGTFPLEAPDIRYTLDPNFRQPAYSVCDVIVEAEGFVTEHIHNVEIVDTQTCILPVAMLPISDEPNAPTHNDIYIPPVGLLVPEENLQFGAPPLPDYPLAPFPDPNEITGYAVPPFNMPPLAQNGEALPFGLAPDIEPIVLSDVVVPDYITVHLGIPTNTAARNVRVKFPDYIKNVVSSEIYSTWPLNSLLANIHAIVTFALNRVFTEWYRSRGFNFDITNSTSYDQYFREGGPVFENISQLVDNYFNVYARRMGFRNPFFTQFCNGTTATCPGLSQWGTVALANQGMTPIQILRYYYPNDIELITSYNITSIVSSYPGYALRTGSTGEAVRRMQNFLNRIRVNYPLIPQISNPNGIFGADTEAAVRTFQRTFALTADGVIGNATWNKISFIYVGVTRLAELDSEGERVTIGQNPPNTVLSVGSRGADVIELQFILDAIAPFYDTIPPVLKDGVFGNDTKNAVIEFQKTFNLTPDGIVGTGTWNKLYAVYRGIEQNVVVPPAPELPVTNRPPYPGTPLKLGSTGVDVRTMQTFLNTIRIVYTDIPYLVVDGVFGPATENAVRIFQAEFLLDIDGVIGPVTWNKIVEMFLLVTGNTSVSLEYPGTPLRVGSTGSAVRLMQGFLNEIKAAYPSIPTIAVDGIFGPATENAVINFQRILGLVPDGIIGPVTWYAIINTRNSII